MGQVQTKLTAAFGKVNITPAEPEPLQGYDPNRYVADPAADILDDLHARVLLLDDGNSRKLMVSVDCCLTNETPFQAADPGGVKKKYRHFLNTFPEGTRRAWGEAAGCPENAVSVHATHTHSAPEHIGGKYTERISATIRQLAGRLRPVRIRAATGQCNVSSNRRPRLQHNDALPVDRTLSVVVFEGEDGTPLGSIINCAVHPTLLMNPFNRVSSEFVGLAMNELERQNGDHFVSLFIQGFSGDVGPVNHYRDEKEDTYPKVREMSRKLYADILQTMEHLREVDPLPLYSGEKKVSLPTREGYFKPAVEVTLHVLGMGELMVFSTSAEVFNGYVQAIRKQVSFPGMLMFSGIANGYNGYLPTKEAFNDGLGGYEMNTTPYREEACEIYLREAAALIGHVQTEARGNGQA